MMRPQWLPRRPILDNNASEMDCSVPPCAQNWTMPPKHEPVHQLPKPSRARGVVLATIAAALIGAGTFVLLSPVTTGTAVAMLMVGPR
jgi:hypothetical protein